jgi:hypothetical protein
MNKLIDKLIFKVNKGVFYFIAILIELLIFFIFGGIALYFSKEHSTFIGDLFGWITYSIIGLPFYSMYRMKNFIDEKYIEKQKIYQLQNLSYLTQKDLNGETSFDKIYDIQLNKNEFKEKEASS